MQNPYSVSGDSDATRCSCASKFKAGLFLGAIFGELLMGVGFLFLVFFFKARIIVECWWL